jgi:uncharacterized repeat protein (TIGR01451 family)
MKTFISRSAVILLAFLLGGAAFGSGQPALLAATGPDLAVKEITLSPTEPTLGETTMITVAVKNLGDVTAGSCRVTCYIDETILETKLINAIVPGITATVSFSWTAAGGSHVIKAVADAGEEIVESDENNNTGTYSLTTLAPDLTVQSITWQPQQASRGDNIIITITIKNQGNVTSRYSNMNLYIDEGARGSQDFNTIQPGATTTKTYNWVVLEGSHTFRASIDENNNNKESDETNNELTVEFGGLRADLTITDLTWSPLSPSKDDIVTFTTTVTNSGAGRADLSYLGYYIDDVFLGMIPTPVLNPGDSCDVTFTWKATLNAHDITVAADYYKMVTENNENNNTLKVSLAAQPPDLMITNVTWTPTAPGAGQQMTLTVYVKNQGAGRADPSQLALMIGTKPPIFLDYPGIGAGVEVSLTAVITAESGIHDIYLTVDYQNLVNESNENNNTYNTTFSVAPPDLLVTAISYTPEKPTIDQTISFTITVANQGKGTASQFSVIYFVDDVSQTMVMVNLLGPESSTSLAWAWKIKNGRHTFKVVIDYENTTVEANDNNNTLAISFAPNLPDLAITNVTWSPAEMPPGQDTVFTIDVENLGGLTAEPSRLVYYVDGIIAGFNDIDAVPAGDKITQTFTWATSQGQHNISIVADSKDQIKEIDETNNTVIVNIPPPDLQIKGVTYSPQSAVSGDVVVITASITNARGSRTPESAAECYVDGVSIGVKNLVPLKSGETGEVSFEWTAAPGSHTFKVCADRNKSVMETDETNNEAEAAFTAAAPDLVTDSIRWSSDNTSNSKVVNFIITVKNAGSSLSGIFSMQCSFDGSQAIVKEMPSINAGATAVFLVSQILSEGAHNAKILLDAKNQVGELNEANNNTTYTFSTITPDLIVRSITWAPITANPGDNVTITGKIENIGLAKVTSVVISLAIDGAKFRTARIPEVDAGASALVDFSWTALEGEHNIEVTADASQSITESNETNNTRSRTIIFAKPELPVKKTPVITLNATTSGGLLQTWWWAFLLVGGVLGLGILYSAIRNMKKQ